MANSYVEYSSGLTATTYSIPFKYIAITDVAVKGYNGTTWSTLAIASRDNAAKTVTLSAAPSTYQKIRVWRNTGRSQLVDFQNGSRLSESDLDTAYQQGLFVAQEVSEVASTLTEERSIDRNFTGTTTVVNLDASGYLDVTGGVATDNLAINKTTAYADLHINGSSDNALYDGLRVDKKDTPTQFAQFNYAGSGLNIIANDTSDEYVDGTVGNPYICLKTSVDASSATEHMRIDKDGNVGIGTTSPAHMLDIVESADDFGARITNNSDDSQGLQVRTSDNDTSKFILDLQTSSSATGTDYASKFVVEKGGNVGIGTSPSTDWRTTFDLTAAQVGLSGCLFNLDVSTGDRRCMMTSNAILNSSGDFQHILEGHATIYSQQSGTHRWYTAASANAGATASANERMRINSSGQVFVNTTSPWGGNPKFHTEGTASNWGVSAATSSTNSGFGAFLGRVVDTAPPLAGWYYNSTPVGTITTNGSATAYNTSSDYRLKENVTDVTDGITRVKQLAPKRFNFIADADTTVDGFIAHEAQAVVPESVTGTKDAVDDEGNPVMQGIDQAKLVPLLTAALQEAIAKIEVLETKVAALEA